MNGYPKHINSKEDILNLKADYPIETKKFLEGLIEASNDWIVVKELEDGEVGIEDNTHKVVENKTDDVVTSRYQFEYMEDSNAYLFKLGFTSVDEVNNLIGGINE